MRRNVCLAMGALFGFFSVLLAGPVICQAKPLSADQLRTEYKTNPLGIDVRRPRLSWIVRAKERGQRQTAYRLLVASSPEVLVENRGDLWDSGRVKSHETVAVVYAGTPLTTARQAFWKVKVWDKAKQPSAWSDPAMWSMGLLEPADWQAHWIGLDCATRQGRGDELSRAFQQANWIWSSPIETAQQAPVARRAFRRDFTLPDEPTTVRAELAVAADNRATVTVNGQEVGEATKFTSGQRFDVTPQLRPGKNCLAIDVENAGDAPNPAGLLGVLVVEFADGGRTVIPTDAKWKTSDAPGEDWTKPDFDAQAWQAASVLGQNGIAPWNGVAVTTLHLPPPRYVRTEFELAKPIRRATLYGSALGLYQLHLNGRPVGDDYFTPGWTDYDQRVYYQTYDVT
ncbi:MAG: alpha-L-rhamnosidase N-terminal domain-containing protein, partial [Pirellulales bacterium]